MFTKGVVEGARSGRGGKPHVVDVELAIPYQVRFGGRQFGCTEPVLPPCIAVTWFMREGGLLRSHAFACG